MPIATQCLSSDASHRSDRAPSKRDDGRLPNFLIVGAAKAGTTSIWQQLRSHPQIFMHPLKRLEFFSYRPGSVFAGPPPVDASREQVVSVDEYRGAFAGSDSKIAVGEASNAYLYSPDAAAAIRSHLPDAKIIAILRNPADRGYSRYLQLRRSGRETETNFTVALGLEEQRIRDNWWPEFHYVSAGLYYSQLARYYDRFPASQIRVYMFDQLVNDFRSVTRDILRFLGVDDIEIPGTIIYGASGLQRSRLLHSGLKAMRVMRPFVSRHLSPAHYRALLRAASWVNNRNLLKPPMPSKARDMMIERYRDDTLKLETLVNKDLSRWYSK